MNDENTETNLEDSSNKLGLGCVDFEKCFNVTYFRIFP